MDRRTLTFITVSVLIIILYQELVLKRLPQSPPAEVPVPTSSLDSASPTAPSSASMSITDSAEASIAPIANRTEAGRVRNETRSRDLSTP